MILIAGATGHLGTETCRRLRARGDAVRALVRVTSDPARVELLRDLGVEIVRGDLKHEASLAAACEGARAVVSTVTMIGRPAEGDTFESVDQRGALNLVKAARTAAVEHFVYVSLDTDHIPDNPLQRAKAAVQDALRSSAMAYTIVQPSLFMESWLGPVIGLDTGAARATILGAGDRKISYIAMGDVAEFVTRVLRDPGARNTTLRIGGEARTQREAIRAFEDVVGRPFTVQEIPEAALEAQWRDATDPMQRTFAALMLSAARGDEVPMAATLERFPIAMTTVEGYAQRVVNGPP